MNDNLNFMRLMTPRALRTPKYKGQQSGKSNSARFCAMQLIHKLENRRFNFKHATFETNTIVSVEIRSPEI
jgi:hypothetical protein